MGHCPHRQGGCVDDGGDGSGLSPDDLRPQGGGFSDPVQLAAGGGGLQSGRLLQKDLLGVSLAIRLSFGGS